jgi:pimeloyl-ACP methyl ester carboxylesterase
MSRYCKAIRSARQRLQNLGSQIIETACGPVEYKQVGDGYPVLPIHGAMGGFDQGLWLAQAFDLTRFRLISVSRFGYLRTPVPPGASLNMQADTFAALLDALNIQQAVVFAVSGGSTAAIRFAARHPERISAIILLGPDAPGKVSMPLPPRFIFDTLLRSDFIYWVMVTFFGKWVQDSIGLVPKGYPLTPEQQAQVRTIQAGDLPASRRIDGMIFETYTCEAEFRQSVTPASPYPLNQIQTPTLVINAADDPISIPENVRALVDQMPNARLYVVPDGGHFLFGHAAEARVEITQFLGAQFLHPCAAELPNERILP